MDNTEKQATLATIHRAMTIKTKNKAQNIKEMSNKRPTKKTGIVQETSKNKKYSKGNNTLKLILET